MKFSLSSGYTIDRQTIYTEFTIYPCMTEVLATNQACCFFIDRQSDIAQRKSCTYSYFAPMWLNCNVNSSIVRRLLLGYATTNL